MWCISAGSQSELGGDDSRTLDSNLLGASISLVCKYMVVADHVFVKGIDVECPYRQLLWAALGAERCS